MPPTMPPTGSGASERRFRLYAEAGLAALLALALHVAFLLVLPEQFRVNQSADFELFYQPVAEALLDGRGLVDTRGEPAIRYPPGFPAVIAIELGAGRALGLSDALALSIGNALWIALGGGAFHLLARSLAARGIAWLATLAWLAYPPFLWLGKQPNSETPFFLIAFLALWTAVGCSKATRAGHPTSRILLLAAATGALVGLAALVRPVALLLTLPAMLPVALVATSSKRLRSTAILVALLCQGAVLLPWEAFMYQQTGKLLPVSSGGRLSLLDGLTISVKPGREGRPAVGEDVIALMRDIDSRRREIRGPADAAAFLARQAATDPLPVAKLLLIKAVRSWYATDSLSFEHLILSMQLPLLGLAGWGALRWPRGDRRSSADFEPRAPVLIFIVTLYFWAMTFLVLSILRYMLPAMALLMLPASWAVAEGYASVRERLRPDGAGVSA